MNVNRFLVAAIGTVLLVAGCKMSLEADLYSSDVRAVANGEQGITTPATLFLPITTLDECATESAKIVAIMDGIVAPFEPKGCERNGMDSFMLANIQMPVVGSADAWILKNTLLGFVAQRREGGPDIGVFIMLDTDKYATLQRRVRDEFMQKLTMEDSRVTVVMNNDEREDMSVLVRHAFVNGQPSIDQTLTMPRREQVTIRLSDVSIDHFGKHGFALAFNLLGME